MKLSFDAGTEKWIGPSKQSLQRLTAVRHDIRLPVMRKMIPWTSGVKAYIVSSEFGDSIRITGGAPWVAYYHISAYVMNLYSVSNHVLVPQHVVQLDEDINWVVYGSTRAYQGAYILLVGEVSPAVFEYFFILPDGTKTARASWPSEFNFTGVVATSTECFACGLNSIGDTAIFLGSTSGEFTIAAISPSGVLEPQAVDFSAFMVGVDAFSGNGLLLTNAGLITLNVGTYTAENRVYANNESTAYIASEDGSSDLDVYVHKATGSYYTNWGAGFLADNGFVSSDDYWNTSRSELGRTMLDANTQPNFNNLEQGAMGALGSSVIYLSATGVSSASASTSLVAVGASYAFARSNAGAYYASDSRIYNSNDVAAPVVVSGATSVLAAGGVRGGARFAFARTGGYKILDQDGVEISDHTTGSPVDTAIVQEDRTEFLDATASVVVPPLERWTYFKYLRLWNA